MNETPDAGENITVLEGFLAPATGCKKCPKHCPAEEVPLGDLERHKELLCEVLDELVGAQENFPPFRNLHEGWAKMNEEVDELWDLVRLKQILRDPDQVREECLQVAAMALRIIFDLDEGGYRQL